MNRVAVESTTLATIAYDAGQQMLQLEFRDRAIYRYFGVPADVYKDLFAASSKGSYFNRSIRGRFGHTRVEATSLS